MGVRFLDQPFYRIPRSGKPLAGNALDSTRGSDILHAKADKLARLSDLDMKETTAASTARLRALVRRRVSHWRRPQYC
jgi:hypothetical protein